MLKTLITCEKLDQAKKYAEILGVNTKNLGGYFENEQYVINTINKTTDAGTRND